MHRRSFFLIPLALVGCSRSDQRPDRQQKTPNPSEIIAAETVIHDGGRDVLVQLKSYLRELDKRGIATPVDANGAGTIRCLGNAPGKWNLPCRLEEHPDVQTLLRRLSAISKGVTLRLDGLAPQVAKTTIEVAIHAVGTADAIGWESINRELDRDYDEMARTLRIARAKPADQNTKISCVRAMGAARAIGDLVGEALQPLSDIVTKTNSIDCPKEDHGSGDQYRGVKALSVTIRINVIDLNIANRVVEAIDADDTIKPARLEVL